MTPQQLVQDGLEHHRAGRRRQAETVYRQALAAQPGNPALMVLLGTLLLDPADGVAAGAASGATVAEAIDLCSRATTIAPNVPEFHNALGAALMKLRRLPAATAAFGRAIACRGDYSEAHAGLGRALVQLGQLDPAIGHLRTAVALKPSFPPGHADLANALRRGGHLDEALAVASRAIELDPRFAWGHNILGLVCIDRSELELATRSLHRAVALNPNLTDAWLNLAQALLRGQGQVDEAVAACRRAIQLQPGSSEAHANLALALMETEHLEEAIDEHRLAVQLNPDSPEAHWNLGLALLLRGDFEHGWAEFDRGRSKNARSLPPLQARPQWDGGELHGRTILLYGEQGFGDTLHLVRYVPLVAARGGRVILACQTELATLLQNFPGVAAIVPGDAPVPPFDLHCSLLSLPYLFKTDLASIPASVPYLQPDRSQVDAWRQRLGPRATGERRIGLVWAGNPKHWNDRNRSIRLQQFAALEALAHLRIYSLQKGPAAAQINDVPGLSIVDVASELKDFADTAALVSQLDLIITVDTAVAHLCGALGRETWVLLPTSPDWRWLLDRTDSPWYPTLRLFRQRHRGDWTDAVADVLRRLREG